MQYDPAFSDEPVEVGLVRLSQVPYQLAEGQPDAMGWHVADEDGKVFGSVIDLLADLHTGQIVLAAIAAKGKDTMKLVPVEGTFLDEARGVLMLSASQGEVDASPVFTDDVVEVQPYLEYWLRLALARAAR